MKAELMRYRNDTVSYFLNLLALVLDAVFLIAMYSNHGITGDIFIGIDILYNILYLLLTFLLSEKVKTYTKKWCYFGFVLGVIQIGRVFFLPLHCYQAGELVGAAFVFAILYLVLSGVAMIAACFTSYKKCKKLYDYLDSIKTEKEGA